MFSTPENPEKVMKASGHSNSQKTISSSQWKVLGAAFVSIKVVYAIVF